MSIREELESFDGRFYIMRVEAHDGVREIGRGTVGRAVVHVPMHSTFRKLNFLSELVSPIPRRSSSLNVSATICAPRKAQGSVAQIITTYFPSSGRR